MIHNERDGLTEGYRDLGMGRERKRAGATEEGGNTGTLGRRDRETVG
jgi:hypothetical protein